MTSLPLAEGVRTMRAFSMRLPVRWLTLLLCWSCVGLAQTASPSPLAPERASVATTPAGGFVAEAQAERALQAGFPSVAAAIYGALRADESLPADARARLALAQITALLDAGDTAAAERELQAYTGPVNSSSRLRAGLLAAHLRRAAQAKAELAEIRAEELPANERAWWYYLQAQLAELDGELPRATTLFEQAAQAAVSDQQRARFLLGQAQVILRGGPPSERDLAAWRGNMERFAGQSLGYDAARFYAAGLARSNRQAEAIAVLERQLLGVPPTQRNIADQLRLLIGLIAGETSPVARRAFRELLRDGLRPDTQRTALYMLARGARSAAEREQLRRDLNELANSPTPHPVIEDILLVRAQAALADRQYNAAEEDARLLLDRFPGSPLKAAALGVRLSVAWNSRLYRTAADISTQLRAVLAPGRERSELGVLLAEAFFRSGDFRNAADAYEAALREAPQVVPTGVLIFQRVLADIRADRLAEAAALLDEMAANPSFDVVNRWQAEWNLIRDMQVRGQNAQAQQRVERLLADAAAVVPGELRVRLLWLRAKLSFDSGDAAKAMREVGELQAQLPQVQLDAVLAREVASTAMLLQAQALLALERDDEATGLLEKLRADYREAKAAVYSYLVQAARQAQRGELAGAQKTLTDMVDANGRSEYAAFALYEAAVYAERQGLDRNLSEAHNILERLVRDYPQDELVFYARLKQGDLLRKLNDFGSARLVYEDLINNRGQHPDVLLAQLELARSLFAQAANNAANFESAVAIFERLRDLSAAPADLRVEAGYMWGYALARRGQPVPAQTVLWSVVDAFLVAPGAAEQLGATGRYWIARALLELGQLLEEGGRMDEAQRAYRLIIDNKLGGAAQAQARLDAFQAAEAAKP